MSTALTRTCRPGLWPGLSRFRRDPFLSFMDRFFDDAFGDVFDVDRPSELAPVSRSWAPPVDIVETDDAFIATADLPGLTKDDIEVSLEDNVLTVSGERMYEKNGDEGTFRRVERAYGSFRRSFTLPSGVDAAKVDASFKDGVLKLTMPKSATAKARKIQIG